MGHNKLVPFFHETKEEGISVNAPSFFERNDCVLGFYIQSTNDGMNKTENKTRYILLLKSGIKSSKSFRIMAITQLQVCICIVLRYQVGDFWKVRPLLTLDTNIATTS